MTQVENILNLLGNRSLFLTGFMGTGKTTVGYMLSETLGIPFYDLDHIIENSRGVAVEEIFRFEGESVFREIESTILKEVIFSDNQSLISLGGGTLVDEFNRTLIRKNGVLIALKAKPEYILPRLNESQIATLLMMTNRPISDSLFTNRIHSAIEDLIEIRKPVYDDVDFWVDSSGRSTEDIIDEIFSKLEDFLKT